jgi:hypothetical protein
MALPLLLYWPLTVGGRVLYWGVTLYQFYPWHRLVVEAIRSGHLPLWNDLLGNGAPLLANHQSATFYPLNLIYFLTPVEHAMGYSVVLHLILSGLFAYAWGRTIGLARFGATVTGLSFMLSGFFVSRTQFITVINGAAWLPLLFLLAERLVRRRTPLDAIWLGVALALQFLAGHAQLWFYSLWAVVIYVLVRILSVRQERTQPKYVFALLAGALLLSLGLSAIQLLPTAELSFLSQRADGLDYDEAMTYSFWPWRLLTLFAPNLFGNPATGDYWGYATYWEDAGYLGVFPLLLALGAAWGWGRGWLSARVLPRFSRISEQSGDKIEPGREAEKTDGGPENFFVPFFVLLILLSLILAMGQNTPVYPLVFKYVPGFGAFRAPARFLLFYIFGVSTLAGIGADRLRLTYGLQYAARLTVAGAGAMLAVSLVTGNMGLPIRPTFAPAISRFALWVGLSAVIVLLSPIRTRLGNKSADLDSRVARSPLPPRAWYGLVVCFISVDLMLFAAPLTPTVDPALYRISTDADRYLLTRADDDRIFATYDYDYNTKFNSYLNFSEWGSPELARWLSFRDTLVPNLNTFSGTLGVNNDEPLVVGRWRALMDTLRNADWPDRLRLFQFMNVGYVLAEDPPPGLSPVENIPNLYRLSEPLPRAWVVPHARVITAPDDLMSEMLDATFDPTGEVLLEMPDNSLGRFSEFAVESTDDPPDHSSSNTAQSPQHSPAVTSLREEINSRTIDLVMSQPGYLVLAYTHYPGWRATVDGQSTELLRANYAFMALPLDAGEHHVVLNYRPVSVMVGAAVSGLSVLAIIGIAVAALRLRDGGS